MPAIDTSNYYPLLRDGRLPELEISDLTESEWMQQHLGRPVLKEFNNILAAHLEHNGQTAGKPGCIVLLVAGDEATAKQQAIALVEDMGFDAVDDGSLHESWRQQPGSPLYCTDLPATEVRQHLGLAWASPVPPSSIPNSRPTRPRRKSSCWRKALSCRQPPC